MASQISSVEQLRELYGAPTQASIKKQASELNPTYRRWLEQSCFFVIASVGEDGVDCTPRGDQIGQAFAVADERTILIPDRRGNNRLDTLSNIVMDPRVALLFFIPGIEQTLRIVGHATILSEPHLLNRFSNTGYAPLTCINVEVKAVYFQNSRALARAGLWSADHLSADKVPSPAQMLQSASSTGKDEQSN